MGRSVTPKYRIETESNYGHNRYAWHVKNRTNCTGYGAPTAANLEIWCERMRESYNEGGVNHHITVSRGTPERIRSARIVNQFTGETVAEYTWCPFQII